MEIDEQFEMVSEKIELLSKASNNFNALKTRFFQFAFALIIGIVPLFYYLSPFNDRKLDSIFAICITIGIVISFTLLSRIYWNYLRRKEFKLMK